MTPLTNDVFNYPLASKIITNDALKDNIQRKEISLFIKSAINIPTIDYNYSICNKDNQDCAPDFLKTSSYQDLYIDLPNRDVYARSIMIANATAQRVFRLYLWETF